MANRDVIEKWVEALESGYYRQTKGALRVADSYCCLGVLCELAADEGVVQPARTVRNPEPEWVYGATPCALGLPPEVINWAGLDSCDPTLFNPDYVWNDEEYGPQQEGAASHFNDEEGMTFTQIAKLIRHTYLENNDG